MCTYNGEKFLSKQLKSILFQTITPSELIICDDRSSDKTIDIIREFALNAPFQVSLHLNPNKLGVVKNFEKAISLCKGDLIFLADQDDVWLPEKIATMSAYFSTNPQCLLLFTDAQLIDEFDNALAPNSLWEQIKFNSQMQKKLTHPEYALWHCIKGNNFATGATLAFRSSLLLDALPFQKVENNDWYHDWWLALNAACQAGLFFLEKPLTQYRIHQTQEVGIGQSNSNQELDLKSKKYNFAKKYSFSILFHLKLKQLKKSFYFFALLMNLFIRYKDYKLR